jgi:hypothetical protein
LLHIAPVGFVAAIGKFRIKRGPYRPQSPGAVTYVCGGSGFLDSGIS